MTKRQQQNVKQTQHGELQIDQHLPHRGLSQVLHVQKCKQMSSPSFYSNISKKPSQIGRSHSGKENEIVITIIGTSSGKRILYYVQPTPDGVLKIREEITRNDWFDSFLVKSNHLSEKP